MKKIFLAIIATAFFFTSCEIETDLEVENFKDPGYSQVLSNSEDLEKILVGSFTRVIDIQTTTRSIGYLLQADQLTTTNNVLQFWHFAFQPRKQFVNSPNFYGIQFATVPWNSAYDGIRGANHVIRWIEGENNPFIIDGVDKSEEALASAYFIKGMAEGTLSSVFDKAYIVNWDSTLEELQVQRPASELLAAAISDLDKAIALTNSAKSSFSNSYMINITLDKTRFSQVINSFAARIIMSAPTTKAEALNTDFAKALTYANNGITSDFSIKTKPGSWYSGIVHWGEYYFSSRDAAYIQADIKIHHLMDSSYPQDYPDAGILAPVTSADPRTSYFTYGTSFGILSAARDRSLFSNYRTSRWNKAKIFIGSDSNYDNMVFLKAELDYIKAEATLKTAGPAAAAAILNSSPRKTIGGITTGSSYAEVMKALHYEYSVELQLAGSGYIQWSFMKRNDLLQLGTQTLMPIPVTELESQGILDVYTFGGATATGVGTALTQGWKDESSYNQ